MSQSSSISSVAEVIAVYPNRIRIAVHDIDQFRMGGTRGVPFEDVDERQLRVGSYVRITDGDGGAILAIIDNFVLQPADNATGVCHILEATPIGFLSHQGVFTRGGTRIAIPPKGAEPAASSDIQAIFDQVQDRKRFAFASLVQPSEVRVPLDGDRFFNKHIAIVGSTGSGKSHTLARILQSAVAAREEKTRYEGLNNSHIVLFDIHGEYQSAFSSANVLTVDNIRIPYWLLNGEELEELLVERGDNQAYNQVSLLRCLVRLNKCVHGATEKVSFDTPAPFSIEEILVALENLNTEQVKRDGSEPSIKGSKSPVFDTEDERLKHYFSKLLEFETVTTGSDKTRKGAFTGELDRFLSRLRSKVQDPRLRFLFDEPKQTESLESILQQLVGYPNAGKANVTIIDLSGIPFEVLSITVSLVSRLIFDFAYHLKRTLGAAEREVPFLLVYEEAHKYVPKAEGSRYRACHFAIERVAKEGRKYGVTLVILSQRPSEISETIFAQCNNFLAMRLTNPDDQNYVRRLLPDSLGPLVDNLPTLAQGEALLIGDASVMPCHVRIDRCDHDPSSIDVNYLQEWKRAWADVAFASVAERWTRR
ncbi:MAG TPA: ATP-binding protein [Polyangiaceae bacterium]|nr:ATP-binding protein [Polyangiaceae bacterium]